MGRVQPFKKFSKLLCLFLCALIWGVGFTAQSEGMNHIGPFTFTFFRYCIAALATLPFFLVQLNKSRRGGVRWNERRHFNSPNLPLKASFLNALALFAGVALQQVALKEISPGKAAFITATYIVWVPIIGFMSGMKVSGNLWAAVGLSLAGLYFLTIHGSLAFRATDLFLVLCAICFALQVMIIGKYADSVNLSAFACLTFVFCALFALVFMLATEKVLWNNLSATLLNIIYVGIFSSAVTQILQTYGQDGTHPAVASLILSLESALSALAAWILIGDRMDGQELIGCGLMFIAIVLAQLPTKQAAKSQSDSKLE